MHPLGPRRRHAGRTCLRFGFPALLLFTSSPVPCPQYERRQHISGDFRGLFQAIEGEPASKVGDLRVGWAAGFVRHHLASCGARRQWTVGRRWSAAPLVQPLHDGWPAHPNLPASSFPLHFFQASSLASLCLCASWGWAAPQALLPTPPETWGRAWRMPCCPSRVRVVVGRGTECRGMPNARVCCRLQNRCHQPWYR